MDAAYNLKLQTSPSAEDISWLQERLRAYNRSQAGNANHLSFLLTAVMPDNAAVGGLFARLSYQWLFIDTLWVAEEMRRQGTGRNLLQRAEDEARRNGCLAAWVDTFSFQACGFYEKNGYTVFGELPGYPPGHTRYFLRKSLD